MQMQKNPLIYYKLIVYTKYMVKGKGRGLLVYLALFCFMLLPLTAWREMRAAQQVEALHCGMPDCHCDCCPQGAVHVSGCRGCSGSLPYLSPSGTISNNCQATPHRLEQVTPVFQAFAADIFHPPKSVSSLV